MKRLLFTLFASWVILSAQSIETKELKYIGMPVAGIFTGQVYLGGNGQLWYWDIFNYQRINPGGPGDKFYINPKVQDRQFDQGFAIRMNNKITPIVKPLRTGGFHDISFEGKYPIGKVNYAEEGFPVAIELQAFSPFIPTDHEESGFPAIVMEYTVKNNSNKPVEAELFRWLQNTANLKSSAENAGKHIISIIKNNDALQLRCSSSGENLEDLPDYGNMTLTLLNPENSWSTPVTPKDIEYNLPEVGANEDSEGSSELGDNLTGALGKTVNLAPGEEKTITYVLSWYYPNLHRKESGFHHLKNRENLRNYYSSRFTSSADVADSISKNRNQVIDVTKT